MWKQQGDRLQGVVVAGSQQEAYRTLKGFLLLPGMGAQIGGIPGT
jgi:hypothetical protein